MIKLASFSQYLFLVPLLLLFLFCKSTKFSNQYLSLYFLEIPIVRHFKNWPIDNARYPQVSQIDDILEKDIELTTGMSDREKIAVIAAYVSLKLDGHRGSNPAISAYEMHPSDLLNNINQGRTEIYCTHYSRIFSQLSSQVGLPTRIIHVRNSDDIQDSNYHHTLVEVFLNDEDKWAVVDLQYHFTFFEDPKTHKLLNIYELIKKVRKKESFLAFDSLSGGKKSQLITDHDGYKRYFGQKNKLNYESPSVINTRQWYTF